MSRFSLAVEKMVYDLPQPNLLPKEKGKRSLRLSGISDRIRGTSFRIGWMDVRKPYAAHWLFPLPAGEGQGEGKLADFLDKRYWVRRNVRIMITTQKGKP